MRITFVRHAESEYNEKHVLQGRIDCDLSAAGEAAARERAKTFDASAFDLCFSSPLKRALRTARILAPGREILTDERLTERGLGEIEGALICDETLFMLKNRDALPPGAETPEEVEERIASFVESVRKDYPGKRILAVSHGGTIHAMMRRYGLEARPVKNLDEVTLEL